MITLTGSENKLFEVLLASEETRVINNAQKSILRVAGGWVRDKLMKRESHDIDITVDNQSGVEFGQNLNKYLASIGEEVKTLAIIQANPDQSKHLETANIRVLGFEIDCVNLRSETYTEENR